MIDYKSCLSGYKKALIKVNFICTQTWDSGATKSLLTEKDALLIGLDCFMLPDCAEESIGFGGTFRNKMINCPVKLTFGNEQKYTVRYDSGFRVVVFPNEIDSQQREKLIRYTPRF